MECVEHVLDTHRAVETGDAIVVTSTDGSVYALGKATPNLNI
jgi:predicted RNA-binding protein with PUA domain